MTVVCVLGRGGQSMMVALGWLLLIGTRSGAASRCANQACSPPIGNLAIGRALLTRTNCCANHFQSLCPHPPETPRSCQEDTHPPSLMTDDPFLHPDTWSPRPAAMVIERSADFGKTWEALRVFSHNCRVEFNLDDDLRGLGSLCTSRYSSPLPCSGGEVIVRTLDPRSAKTFDPYSPEALVRLTITNLRIRLLKAQTCPASVNSSATWTNPTATSESPPSAPFAISTLLARGTCLCHGHAEYCLPHKISEDKRQDSDRVFGKCLCVHHTDGDHCERCAPLYKDRPWRPANGSSGEPNPCQKCECHGHAESCHFSLRAWISTGGVSGGVCNDCQHNTEGRRCQRCRHGYYRHRLVPLKSPYACTRCWCDPRGSLPPLPGQVLPWCDPRSGQCRCKPGVGGMSCSHCRPGYWGFREDGCMPCVCPNSCDPTTGLCLNSYSNNHVLNVPIGGKIPYVDDMFTAEEEWSKEHAVSALHYTGKCRCKEKSLRTVSDLCETKHDYVMKASVLSAHDKGSHAEVRVKVRKVLRSGRVALRLGTASVFPLSWTRRGCTCPVLNPGVKYLLAGPEEPGTGRLLVTMQSIAVPWTPRLSLFLSEALRNGCL